ncbi:hypothetical protein M9H77_13023 [Catharanthus roseus]|uniref:Uncharacterized protein n=1 Tax=Catharanthus roseus TaxID=4058 RepID=A0ACC0BJ69_CATRO|nr:hypothetical protein M9H77_13023 [Catharanthus roseus]
MKTDIFLEADFPKLAQDAIGPHGSMPYMKIEIVDYQRLWRPWQKALIIKVLSRNISHKLLMERNMDIRILTVPRNLNRWSHRHRLHWHELQLFLNLQMGANWRKELLVLGCFPSV